MAAPWAHRYAQRTKSAKSSIIRELLKLTRRPEVISFAGGLPAPEVFPVARFKKLPTGSGDATHGRIAGAGPAKAIARCAS